MSSIADKSMVATLTWEGGDNEEDRVYFLMDDDGENLADSYFGTFAEADSWASENGYTIEPEVDLVSAWNAYFNGIDRE